MRFPFRTARFGDEAWGEALDSLRYALRQLSAGGPANPFGSGTPLLLGDPARTAKILRIF